MTTKYEKKELEALAREAVRGLGSFRGWSVVVSSSNVQLAVKYQVGAAKFEYCVAI